MFALRRAKKMDPSKIGAARTHEGSVSVFVPADGSSNNTGTARRVTCNTKAALDELLMRQLNITSEKFVKSWPVN